MEKKTLKTLNQRIEDDLKDLYNLLTKQIVLKDVERENPISEAVTLSKELFGGDGMSADGAYGLSCFGLPGYFTGKRSIGELVNKNEEASTVMVMLNPGRDVMENDNPLKTLHSLKKYGISLDSEEDFIRTYKESCRRFGENDIDRKDNFDIKQAAFLESWDNCGVDQLKEFPQRIRDLNEKTRDEYLKIVKRNVLMQKLQLELIPYASRRFDTSTKNLKALLPYLETVLHEITQIPRDYVIFCSDIFEKLFKYAQQEKIATIETLLKDDMNLFLKEGKNRKARCTIVNINYNHKFQKALIAHTFPNQALSNAYEKMQKYGAFCYARWNNSQR